MKSNCGIKFLTLFVMFLISIYVAISFSPRVVFATTLLRQPTDDSTTSANVFTQKLGTDLSGGPVLNILLEVDDSAFNGGNYAIRWDRYSDDTYSTLEKGDISNSATLKQSLAGNKKILSFDGFDGDNIDSSKYYAIFVIAFGQNVYGSASNTWTNGSNNASPSIGTLNFAICNSNSPCGLSAFYAQVKNTSSGSIELLDNPNTSASIIKTLPEDWVIHVDNTSGQYGSPTTADGYHWYQVTDPTDNVSGWMQGEDSESTVQYLPYDSSQQSNFLASSSNTIDSSSRPPFILDVVNHYYNDTSTTPSLYSSDDVPTEYKISQLKDGGFPEKLIWGMAVEETGKNSPNFDNENVSFDYGHGIMQLTFNALDSEPSINKATYDHRGVGSKIEIPRCASVGVSNYIDCYMYGGTGNLYPKPYKHYQGYSNNPIYKYYTNTEQSIYANIKDAMNILSQGYYGYNYITSGVTVNSVYYSADDIKNILAVRKYNGASDEGCSYVDRVADDLDNIGNYFSGESATDLSSLITLMHTASDNTICAQLYSPGDLSIQDSKGRIVGIVNGKSVNDFPLAVYDKERKYVDILASEDNNYKYKITGTDKGTYSLNITIKNGKDLTKFKASKIAMLPGEIHTYSIEKDALLKGEDGVTLSVDRKGNGVIDRTLKTGFILTGDDYNQGATPEELEAFKIGDLSPKVLPKPTQNKSEMLLSYPRFSLPAEKPKVYAPFSEKVKNIINQ